jgi:hypothetical protein
MIEKFYAAHIKTTPDASAINVRKGIIQQERKSREGGEYDSPPRGRRTRGRRTNDPGSNEAKHARRRNRSGLIDFRKIPVGRSKVDGYNDTSAGVAELVDAPDLNVGRWLGNGPVACCQIR